MDAKYNTPRTVCKAIVAVAIAAIIGVCHQSPIRRQMPIYPTLSFSEEFVGGDHFRFIQSGIFV